MESGPHGFIASLDFLCTWPKPLWNGGFILGPQDQKIKVEEAGDFLAAQFVGRRLPPPSAQKAPETGDERVQFKIRGTYGYYNGESNGKENGK